MEILIGLFLIIALLLIGTGIILEFGGIGLLVLRWKKLRSYGQHLVKNHPAKGYGITETLFWLIWIFPLIDHSLDPRGSTTAWIVWIVTILPHEAGHFICMPFGTFIMFAGGSLWQVLIFLLVGGYLYTVRRYITVPLFFLMIAGHSFINMSVYIRDASDRQLDLILGLDKSHHDWWNLLRRVGLLDYDFLIADIAFGIGLLLILGAIVLGMWTAWSIPRQHIGPHPRYERHPSPKLADMSSQPIYYS
jgi:hypothetical protein